LYCISSELSTFGAQGVPLLKTKLYIPPLRSELVSRPRLIERLDAALGQNGGVARKLTLISAPAGFGRTTLLSECAARCGWPVAWVSLDEGDNDPTRFWAYFVAALRTIPSLAEADVGGSGIYGKLGVHSRYEAVARAQELNLL
jgi:LuxR family maltose regulon positive regulatory protein